MTTIPTLKTVDMSEIYCQMDRNPGDINSLKTSIKEHGLIQPIVVIENGNPDFKYTVVAGRRRWLALSQLIDAKEIEPRIPVVVQPKTVDVDVQAIAENTQRKDLDYLELAHKISILRGNHDMQTIADILGVSLVTARRVSRINDINPKAITTMLQYEKQTGYKLPLWFYEAIAIIPRESQETFTDEMLDSMDALPTYKELYEQIEREFFRNLKTAFFKEDTEFEVQGDELPIAKATCIDCLYRQDTQTALFDTQKNNVTCNNNACFNIKSLLAIRNALENVPPEVPLVRAATGTESIYGILRNADPGFFSDTVTKRLRNITWSYEFADIGGKSEDRPIKVFLVDQLKYKYAKLKPKQKLPTGKDEPAGKSEKSAGTSDAAPKETVTPEERLIGKRYAYIRNLIAAHVKEFGELCDTGDMPLSKSFAEKIPEVLSVIYYYGHPGNQNAEPESIMKSDDVQPSQWATVFEESVSRNIQKILNNSCSTHKDCVAHKAFLKWTAGLYNLDWAWLTAEAVKNVPDKNNVMAGRDWI